MITVNIDCFYCGNRWKESFSNPMQLEDLHCHICKDKNLKISKPVETGDQFGYESQEPKQDAYFSRSSKG